MLSYHDLLKQPELELEYVIRFLRPELEIDHELIHQVCEAQSIAYKNNIMQSEFYNEALFFEAESLVLEELDALKIKRLF